MGWMVNVTPLPLYPREETRYLSYRRLSGPQGQSGRVRKVLNPPGFDPHIVQSVASCTDCDITAHKIKMYKNVIFLSFYMGVKLGRSFVFSTVGAEEDIWSQEG
jgi:hypothetical protein